ncbi:MAG: hypothetical protein VW268_07790 [Rhodospirillaceae bacterium]
MTGPPRPARTPERALAYPYDIPDQSFVIDKGAVRPVTCDDDLGDLNGRIPVLAVGSNQSIRALSWKFGGPEDGPVPCVRVHLKDFDSVYCAHIAGYGSLPATLHTSPGTTVTLFVNWLTEEQLAQMHGTEVSAKNYVFGELSGIDMTAEAGPQLTKVGLYLGTRGALTIDGCPVPLASIRAVERRWRALSQPEVMGQLQTRFACDGPQEAFIQELIDDQEARLARCLVLRETADPFDHPGFSVP